MSPKTTMVKLPKMLLDSLFSMQELSEDNEENVKVEATENEAPAALNV
jgi:hypothetical protein